MNTIKAIIIEDEMPAVEVITSYLKNHKEIDVVAVCNDGFTGLKAIQEHKPDIIFLDVQMPKLTGFEVLELLDNPPPTIFTTAFDEYAIKAFEINAIDYLMKPFSQQRFATALAKAIAKISSEANKSDFTKNKASNRLTMPQILLERIVVKTNQKIVVIPVQDISHIEAWDDYVLIFADDKKYVKQKTMNYYENSLDPQKYIRIHRSWIVNIDFIEHISLYEKDTYIVKLKTGVQLRTSRSGYKRLKDFFN